MSDREPPPETAVQVAILGEKVRGVGETVKSVDEKIDTLIEGFGEFKVTQTEAFGRVDARFAVNDEWRRNHDIARERRDRDVDQAIAKAARSGPVGEGMSKKQAGAAAGGIGIVAILLTKALDWIVAHL